MFWLLLPLVLGIVSVYFYRRRHSSSTSFHTAPRHDHAIIIGGSIGGMITAASIVNYFRRITIIESDDVLNDAMMNSTPAEILDYRCSLESPTSIGRSGVPQIYQLHVIEGEGHKIMQQLFPHLDDILCNEHAINIHSLKDDLLLSINGVKLSTDVNKDLQWLGADRFTLETVLRRELCRMYGDRIEWKSNARVINLIVDEAANKVRGVKYRCRKSTTPSSLVELLGDFIVDCSGRNSSSTKWLKEHLNLNVPSIKMHLGLGYVTFIGERFKTDYPEMDARPMVGCSTNSPDRNTGCYVTAVRKTQPTGENSLGTLSTVTLHCVNAEYPPNDSYENLLAWAKENLDDGYYCMLKSMNVRSPLVPFRHLITDRKLVETLGKQWPQNYVLLGDAMCTFNPQFGQGMTHASRHARELSKVFADHRHALKDISHIYNRRAAAISEECWLLSTANDWKIPTLKIVTTDKDGHSSVQQREPDSLTSKTDKMRAPLLIRVLQWYTYWFLRCASHSGKLATDFLLIMNQEANAFVLFKPNTILTVCSKALSNYWKLSN